MPSGVQRFSRTKMVLPLRFWPGDGSVQGAVPQLAHTLDISPIGGRLGGLRNPLQSGQTIMLQRGKNRTQFRVIWTKQLGPGEIQAGVEAVAPEQNVWGVELPYEAELSPRSQTSPALPTPNVERRIPRVSWMAIAAVLLATAALGFTGYWIAGNLLRVATMALPSTTPPVVVPVAARPKSYGNVKVFFSRAEGFGSNRMQVAEAPQGHVVYPDAPDGNLTGTVGMKAVIATDGRVKEIHVLNGNRILAEAAVQAVRFWRYAHHEMNGEAVEAETSVIISFHGRDAVSIKFPRSASKNDVTPKAKVAG